jgi:hypothetical protein
MRCSCRHKGRGVEADPRGYRISFGRITRRWPTHSSALFHRRVCRGPRRITTRWTRAAAACFARYSVRRGLDEIAPPRQLTLGCLLRFPTRLLKNPGSVALLIGILLILSAGWFLLWTWSSASLRCVPCDCRYDLSAANSYCRLPAILVQLFCATFIGAIASFVVAWCRARRTAA